MRKWSNYKYLILEGVAFIHATPEVCIPLRVVFISDTSKTHAITSYGNPKKMRFWRNGEKRRKPFPPPPDCWALWRVYLFHFFMFCICFCVVYLRPATGYIQTMLSVTSCSMGLTLDALILFLFVFAFFSSVC